MRSTVRNFHFQITEALLGVCLALSIPNQIQAITVGPDTFGYVSIDSTTSGGPSSDFHDISATGSRLTFVDADNLPLENADDGVAPNIQLTSLNGGAGFPFYGTSFTEVHMSTNGFLTFALDDTADALSNLCPVPNTAAPNNAIYVLWDDLVLSNSLAVTKGGYVQNFDNCPLNAGGATACIIFQWEDADHFGGGIDSFDFQVALYANGNILMNYGSGNPETGSGSTSGIENSAASIGLTHVCDSAGSIPSFSSILFTPLPPAINLNKTVAIDTGVELCSLEESVSVTPGQSVRYCFTVVNTGFLPVTTHTLIDDELGTILNNFAYTLSPGASAYITQVTPINSSTSANATWSVTTDWGASAFSTDNASVIVDADGDGTPDEGDLCPSDPNKVTAGQCGCGTPDSDSDGDAFLDCLDQCPADSNKSVPLICGCGTQDLDLNVNGVIDCQLTPDLKAQLKRLLTQVGKLGASKNPIKPNKVKKTLVGVVNQINLSGGALTVTANTDVAALSLSLDKAVRKALKVNNENFAKNKNKARSRIKAMIKVLVV